VILAGVFFHMFYLGKMSPFDLPLVEIGWFNHQQDRLGGGFILLKIFSPLPGEMIQIDEHIFQMGWFNHQLDRHWDSTRLGGKDGKIQQAVAFFDATNLKPTGLGSPAARCHERFTCWEP